MKKRNILLILLIIISFFLSGCSNDTILIETSINEYNDSFNTYYGYLTIPTISLHLGFYPIGSNLNTVSKNIELIETGITNTYLIAAHSGSGYLAYFNDLRYLNINDDLYLEFKDYTNHYQITNIRREKKDGNISIKNEENQLILTTCDQIVKGYQLIIEAKLVA